MSASNSSLSIAELMFDEAQNIIMETENNMKREMGNLVRFRDVLKKEIDTLESSKSLEKCSLEEKLRRSEMRREELEKRFVQKEEENAKLLCQKWDAEAKLEKSVKECEELMSEQFHAYQRMEEKNEEKLDVDEKLGRSERKCKELMSENVDANQRMEELRVKKMESEKTAQLYKNRFHDLELKMMKNVRRQAKVLNVNLANLVDSGEVSAAAGDRDGEGEGDAMSAGDSGGIGLSKKGALRGNCKSINPCCKLDIMNKIKKNLGRENLEMFEQSCFGHLLKMNQPKYQGQLVLMLLLHIDKRASNKERLVFKINNSNIEFQCDDFCRITGLHFGTSEATARYSSIHDDVFQGRTSIKTKDVEEAFFKASRDHEGRGELTLKLALLYFLYGTFLARNPSSKKIDLQYLHLIDDLQKFNAFPWGRVAYEYLVSSIFWVRERIYDLEVSNKRKFKEIHGFIFALQVWAYEVMPCVATQCASRADNFENLHPHILRWTPTTKAVRFNHLKKFFAGGDQTHLVEKRESGMKGLERCSSDEIFISEGDDEILDTPPRKRKRSRYRCIKSEETADDDDDEEED